MKFSVGAASFVVRRRRDVGTKNKERESGPIDCVSAELREPSCTVTSTS